MLGPKIKFLLVLSLPLGILVGLVEILFAISLNDLLISTNLIQGTVKIDYINPIYFILIVALIRFFFLFLTQLNSNYIFELVNKEIREITIKYNYNFNKEIGLIKSQKILNIISTKIAEFLHSCSGFSIQSIIFIVIYLNLLNISFFLTIIVSIIFLFISSPLILIKKKISMYSHDFQNNLSKVTEKIFKDIRNLNFLRIVGSLKMEREEIIKKNKKTLKPYLRYLLSISFINQIPHLIGILILSTIIISNNKFFLIDNSILVTFLYLMLRCIINFGNIVNDYGRIVFTKPFVKNLISVTNISYGNNKENLNENKNAIKITSYESLSVNNLSIGYENIIKSNLNFKIKKGTFNLFKGSSGTGKTALLMSLIGILKRKSGEIYWDDIPLDNIDLINFRKKIAYCGTDPFLIEGTIEDNLNYGLNLPKLNTKQAKNILEICNCEFIKSNNEYNLEFYLDNEGSGLSSGQRQRISLARSLIKNPEILILDEATVNIDEDNEFKIIKKIKEKFNNCTIFAISHRKSLEKFADQIISL